MPDCVETRERCNRKSVISVSLRHFLSDPRPRVTRPAPAGHTTCARGSLTFSDFEMELYDFGLANTGVGMCRRPPNIHFHQKIVINQRQILISAVDL